MHSSVRGYAVHGFDWLVPKKKGFWQTNKEKKR